MSDGIKGPEEPSLGKIVSIPSQPMMKKAIRRGITLCSSISVLQYTSTTGKST